MSKHPYGVLIIHGFTANLNNVRDLAPPLEALGLPVRMPLLHGHGQNSPEALRGVTWADWLASAQAGLQDLLTEADKAIVVGHSLGGLLTLNLAADHADQIDSIVLVAAALRFTSPLAPGRPLGFLRPLIKLAFKRWNLQAEYSDTAQIARDTNYRWAPTDSIMSLLEFSEVTRNRLGEGTPTGPDPAEHQRQHRRSGQRRPDLCRYPLIR